MPVLLGDFMLSPLLLFKLSMFPSLWLRSKRAVAVAALSSTPSESPLWKAAGARIKTKWC